MNKAWELLTLCVIFLTCADGTHFRGAMFWWTASKDDPRQVGDSNGDIATLPCFVLFVLVFIQCSVEDRTRKCNYHMGFYRKPICYNKAGWQYILQHQVGVKRIRHTVYIDNDM